MYTTTTHNHAYDFQFSPYHIRYSEIMNLAGNNLTGLCPDFSMMKYLRDMNLESNCLRNLPDSLSDLQKLTVSTCVMPVL
jgi:hypothetical protein